jgi:uncharacterized membrane protein
MTTKTSSSLGNDFLAGMAVCLPAIISIGIVVWLFGAVSNITDKLLFAVPGEWKYINGVRGEIHWYWSLAALLLAVGLVTIVGRLTRFYLGRKLVELGDNLLLRVPLLNRIYSTVKQVKEAFAGNKSSFQQAVLVEFPRAGVYSLGFITSEQRNEVQVKTPQTVWSVFVPTTPNPTSGFLVYVPDNQLVRLDMSVADAIKSIITLGSVAPEYFPVASSLQAKDFNGTKPIAPAAEDCCPGN